MTYLLHGNLGNFGHSIADMIPSVILSTRVCVRYLFVPTEPLRLISSSSSATDYSCSKSLPPNEGFIDDGDHRLWSSVFNFNVTIVCTVSQRCNSEELRYATQSSQGVHHDRILRPMVWTRKLYESHRLCYMSRSTSDCR